MSRLAKKPIVVPDGVKIDIKPSSVFVEGKKGKLEQTYEPFLVSVEKKDDGIYINRQNETKQAKSSQGLYWKLVKNMVEGVTEGFSKKLQIKGIGYKWDLNGKTLKMNVGYSHPVDFVIPETVEIKVEKSLLTVSGIDKQIVGQVAANIRAVKKPEPYKGKGVRYENERVIMKEGKSAKK